MKHFISTALALALAAFTVQVFADKDRDHGDDDGYRDRPSVCAISATKMYRSCRFEVNEEYNATTAKCINLGDRNERHSCLEIAHESRREDRAGCADQREARNAVCDLLGENRYDPEALLDTENFVEEPDGSNPYFSLARGHTYVARAGDGFEETIIVTLTEEVREILGVNCRLVVDVVLSRTKASASPWRSPTTSTRRR